MLEEIPVQENYKYRPCLICHQKAEFGYLVNKPISNETLKDFHVHYKCLNKDCGIEFGSEIEI